jgi:hypothetical protein
MSYVHPAAAEHLRKRWTRPDAYRFAAPGTPEAKMPGYLHPWAAVARAEDEARWAAEDEALERDVLQRKLWDLRRQLDEVKCELAARRAAERREAEELRIKSDLAFERFRRVLTRYIEQQKAGFDPNQPRVPAGNSDGGQWTSARGTGRESRRDDAGGAVQLAADNQRQNKMVRDVVVRLRLTQDQQQELHRAISGQGYSYHQVLEIAKDMFGK